MWRNRLRRLLVMLSACLVALGIGFPAAIQRRAEASNGQFVHKTHFSAGCSSGVGVGIAFDGEYLWYSCYQSNPDLFKARALDGTVVASYNIANGLGALAWDGARKQIWAGWGGGGNGGKIYLIDPATGTGRVVFTAREAATSSLDDGLALDASNGTLLVSADGSNTIYKYDSLLGRYLGSFTWTGGAGCYNSGLAVGGNLLYQGANGCNRVYVVQKDLPIMRAFSFSTVVPGDSGYRDEDLECDSVTFQGSGTATPRTVMWSIEAYEPRRAVAFEVPLGSCSTGGGVDADGDGLLDEWELHGLWQRDSAGQLHFVDLPQMGADPRKPDIFLHIDWMEDRTHNTKIPFSAIKQVVDAFAAAPYVSPTGSTGINLHVDEGPDSYLDAGYTGAQKWGSLSRAHAVPWVDVIGGPGRKPLWDDFDDIKKKGAGNFADTGRGPLFHYVLVGNWYNSNPAQSSGISRGIGASDLIVTLGNRPGTIDEEYAGTLMHELGHNLGLRHGGSEDVNYKPNYLSVMSYSFQLSGVPTYRVTATGPNPGLRTDYRLDYSRKALPALDENRLNELEGLGPEAGTATEGYGTVHWCTDRRGFGTRRGINIGDDPIDWNCNGTPTDFNNIRADINLEKDSSGKRVRRFSVLTGFDDWAHLQFKAGWLGYAGFAPDLPTDVPDQETISVEELREESRSCTAEPSLTWGAPLDEAATANISAGGTLPIRFSYGACEGFIRDESVIIQVVNSSDPDIPVTSYVYGSDIAIDDAAHEYRQDFRPAAYGVAVGANLQVQVFLAGEMAGTASVSVSD